MLRFFKHKVEYISSNLLIYHFFLTFTKKVRRLKHGVIMRFVGVVYFCSTFDCGGPPSILSPVTIYTPGLRESM